MSQHDLPPGRAAAAEPGTPDGAGSGPVPEAAPARYWRSLEALAGLPEPEDDPPADDDPAVLATITRRAFLGVSAASMAAAALAQGGCIRKPVERILPYSRRPEDLIPGRPRYFATSAVFGGSVLGLLVESQDGRPTKIEGNPQHPGSGGAASAWAQASVYELYGPDRSQRPVNSAHVAADWNWKADLPRQADRLLVDHVGGHAAKGGEGLAVLVGETRSPTVRAQLVAFQQRFPRAHLYRHDSTHPEGALAGAALAGVTAALPVPDLERADVILALDSDFLGVEGDVVRHSGQFARRRRVRSPDDSMNRLYVAEPAFTVTGAKADHRVQLAGSQLGAFLSAVAAQMVAAGLRPIGGAEAIVSLLRPSDGGHGKLVAALAKDLVAHTGRAVILVGERQPAWVHALAHVLNASLGATGQTVVWRRYEGPVAGSISDLAGAITRNEVTTLVMLGGNPAYDAPVDLSFAELIGKVPVTVHHSPYLDETSRLCSWHLPASHFLEAWGDTEASDGTASIQQPLIAPLYSTLSEVEVLARILNSASVNGYDVVRAHWASRSNDPDFEDSWRRWLHDGVIPGTANPPLAPTFSLDRFAAAVPHSAGPSGVELAFQTDASVHDGRYAINPWLQEMPDPLTKLTWDNAAIMGPPTAERLGLHSRDLVEIRLGSRALTIAVWISPGVADDTVVLPLGYGRRAGGQVAVGRGFDTYALRTSDARHFATGATIKRLEGHYELASTQSYGSLTPTTHDVPGLVTEDQGFEERPILRETTLAEYRRDPHFVDKLEAIEKDKIQSLFTEPHPWKQPGGLIPQQWGMSIDLSACTGCNACVIACQAENNTSVVGKKRVLQRRDLAWIRLDRYFSGSVAQPRVSVQPMLCQQCENAPCETVCPVNATTHSSEGLNDMAYNRCIGTRYCSNNCPYKVRRFNYFNFSKENDEAMPLLAMQRNPDVTVRFRGVMEKCTFCVQRINEAKIDAKRDGDGRVPDKTVVPACAQTCPTRAIVFGDVSDPHSEVSAHKRLDRDYSVLAELNTKPRLTYLAGLRNTNPDLE